METSGTPEESRLTALPPELLSQVVGYLSPSSVASLGQGSRNLYSVVPELVQTLRGREDLLAVGDEVEALLARFPRLQRVEGVVTLTNDRRSLQELSSRLRGSLNLRLSWDNELGGKHTIGSREIEVPQTQDYLNLLAVRALLYPNSEFSASLVEIGGRTEFVYRYDPTFFENQGYLHVTLGLTQREKWDGSLLSRVPITALGLDIAFGGTFTAPKEKVREFMRSLTGKSRIRELVSRRLVSWLDPALFPHVTTVRFLLPPANPKNANQMSRYISGLFSAPISTVTTIIGAHLYYGYMKYGISVMFDNLDSALRTLATNYPNLRYGDIKFILFPKSEEPVPGEVIQEVLKRIQIFRNLHPDLIVTLEVWSQDRNRPMMIL